MKDFEDFLLYRLWIAYLEARKGKRKTFDEHIFELNDIENIVNLRDDILNRTYEPSPSEAFIIHDPVIREIFAAPFRDRIVHHLIYDFTYDWWDKHFIPDSYSCRVGRGTLYGKQRFERHARAASNNFSEDIFVAKLDLSGYFMSLNRKKLLERALWGLDRQFKNNKGKVYWMLRYLWRQTIMDDPVSKMRIRGKIKDWDKVPKNKSLIHQPKGYGIVIGNLTSQLLSNIYLDQLDRYITFNLGYKHYGRYVDDFYIIVKMSEKEKLLGDIKKIENYLKTLELTLHPKKRTFTSLSHGINFLGDTLYPGYMVPGKRVKTKTKKAFRDFAEGHGDIESVTSYLGHLKHTNSTKFLSEVFDSLGWDFEPGERNTTAPNNGR